MDIGKATIAKSMVRQPGPPDQAWQTFIRKHMVEIVLMITAYNGTETMVQAMKLDAFDDITKPIELRWLGALVPVQAPRPRMAVPCRSDRDNRFVGFDRYPGLVDLARPIGG